MQPENVLLIPQSSREDCVRLMPNCAGFIEGSCNRPGPVLLGQLLTSKAGTDMCTRWAVKGRENQI